MISNPSAKGRTVTDLPRRGELWWCKPPEIGRRPVVVVSRDAAIPSLRRAQVAPCVTTLRGLPSDLELQPGEDRCRAVNLDAVESVSVALLARPVSRVTARLPR